MEGAKNLKITLGGWYPRTTIHLREIYDFFASGSSETRLPKDKLREYHRNLGLQSVSREAGNLEYVRAVTGSGIEIRYYEDGLFTLSLDRGSLGAAKQALEQYHHDQFNPALNFLFSLGAPTPKVLANIKTVHPVVVSVTTASDEKETESALGEHIYEQVRAGNITLYKTPHFFLIAGKGESEVTLRELVEMQIYFREFKDQLEHYLNTHRLIWEEIEAIKEQRFVRGQDLGIIRSRLDSYQKTINLISSRIKQMGSYVDTRKSIAAKVKIEEPLSELFQYKFEVLLNTLAYIRQIWSMTDHYLSSALQVMDDLQAQSTKSSIDSLRTITTIGVISGLLGYFASTELPKITTAGVKYFVLLLLLTVLINSLVAFINKRRRYKVTLSDNQLNF